MNKFVAPKDLLHISSPPIQPTLHIKPAPRNSALRAYVQEKAAKEVRAWIFGRRRLAWVLHGIKMDH